MYSKLFALAALFTLAVAAPGAPQEVTNHSCNVGKQHCCNSVQSAHSKAATKALAGLANIITGPITGQVGITCSPISVIGAGSSGCTAQPACCTGNNFNGLIVAGCNPISIL